MIGSAINMENIYKLDIEECKRRIDSVIDKRWTRYFIHSTGIVGRIKSDSFCLKKNKELWSNDFARMFYGKLISQDNGTIIKGSFKLTVALKVFMSIWFGFLALFEILVCIALIFHLGNLNGNSPWPFIGAPIGMSAFMILLVKSGTRFWQNEENYIANFIKTTLEAEETPILAKTNI